MRREKCHTLARATVVTLVLVATVVALSSCAGSAVALEENVTIERTDVDLRVTVAESELGDESTAIDVAISAGEGNDTRTVATFDDEINASNNVFSEPVVGLPAGVDLSEATVAVSVGDSPNVTETVDLRRLALEGGDDANITADGHLVVDVIHIAGLEPTALDVTVAQGARNATDDWSLEERDEEWVVTGDVRVLHEQEGFALLEDVNVTVAPEDPRLEQNLTLAPSEIADSPLARQDGDEVVLRHALLFEDEEVLVQAETAGPDGRYVTVQEPSADGDISVPVRLLFAEDLQLAAERTSDESEVFDAQTFTVETQHLSATVGGGNLSIGGGEPFVNATLVWLQSGGDVVRFDRSAILDGATLDVSDAPVSFEGEVQAIVVGDETTRLRLTATAADANGTDEAGESAMGIGSADEGEQDRLIPPRVNPLVQGGLIGALVLLTVVWVAVRTLDLADSIQTGVATVSILLTNVLAMALLVFSFVSLEPVPVVEFVSSALVVAALLVGCWAVLSRRQSGDGGLQRYLYGIGIVASIVGVAVLALYFLDLSPMETLATGALYGLLATGISALPYALGTDTSSDTTSGSVAGSHQNTVDVTVKVYDKQAGQLVENADIRYDSVYHSGDTTQAPNGETTVPVVSGSEWTFTAIVDGQEATTTETIDQFTDEIVVEFPGHTVDIEVTTKDGEPLQGAKIDIDDGSGTVTQDLRGGRRQQQFPVTTSEVEIAAEHDLYARQSKTIDVRRRQQVSFRLSSRTGRLDLSAKLDGRGVPDVDITATRQGTPDRTHSSMTDSRGQVSFKDVLVGEYRIVTTLPVESEAFVVSSETVYVEENERKSARLNVTFEYALSSGRRGRIRTLRSRLDDIAMSSRRDDAIQQYYASVLVSVLDELENVPRAAYDFLEHRQAPDDVVDAVLDVVEGAVETLDDALSSKRNVDLFSACSGLTDVNVTYNERVDLAQMLQMAEQDVGEQRAAFTDRLEVVDERITEELRELAEVSPAREMWEGVRDMVRDQGGLSRVEMAASMFVAGLLLDAVESLFEQPQLRKRMEQSVY